MSSGTPIQNKGTIGRLHPKMTMFFRQHVGEASDPETGKPIYELSFNVGGSSPIVHDVKSGLWFTLSWEDIIKLAVDAGINGDGK